MRRLLWMVLSGALSLWGQSYSGVAVDAITYSSARLTWTTSFATSSVIRYGTTTGLGLVREEISPVSVTTHWQFLSGLTANTQYFYRLCSTVSSCDGTTYSFTTAAAPAIVPAMPVPTNRLVVPAMPVVPSGRRYTVAADCSDLQSRVNSVAAMDGNLDYEILIPAAADCSIAQDQILGNANQPAFTFPAKSGPNPNGTGEIIIRSAAADSELPPAGVRTGPAFFSKMPTLRNNNWGVQEGFSTPSAGTCALGQLWWDFFASLSNGWPLKQCTAPSSNGYSLTARIAFSGAVPSSCVAGTWYHKTDVGNATQGIYRCAPSGKLYRLQLGRVFGFAFAANAHHYRIVGVQFSVVPLPNPHESYLTGALGADGTYYVGHISIPATAHHIYFDRCRLTGLDYPQRIQQLVNTNGSQIAFVNNHIDQISYWLTDPNAPSNQTETQVFNVPAGAQLLFENNLIESSGFGLIATEDVDGQTTDVVVARNTFLKPERYRYGTAENTAGGGWFYHARHCVELKRGERWLIDGNVCDGNYLTVNQGHFIALSPRPLSSLTVVLQDVQITNNTLRNGPNGIFLIGHNDFASRQMPVMRRVLVENNMLLNLDGNRSAVPGRTGWGQCFSVLTGMEDLTVRRNLCRDQVGVWPAFLWEQYGPSAGLDFRDNIVWHKFSAGYGGLVTPGCAMGSASLACGWAGWRVQSNAIVNQSGQDPNTYPAGSFWLASEASLGFSNAAGGDFGLSAASPFRRGAPVVSGVSGPASDGGSVGPSQYQLRAAQGQLGTVAVRAGDQQALFTYSAPDGRACAVDVSPDGTFQTGVVRFGDGGGTRHRQLAATGLTGSTSYAYRVLCGEQRSGTLLTGSGGQAFSLPVGVRPPAGWLGMAEVAAEFGTTPALGSQTVAASCASGCTVFVPSTIGRVIYYRVVYRNAGGTVVARGGLQAAIP